MDFYGLLWISIDCLLFSIDFLLISIDLFAIIYICFSSNICILLGGFSTLWLIKFFLKLLKSVNLFFSPCYWNLKLFSIISYKKIFIKTVVLKVFKLSSSLIKIRLNNINSEITVISMSSN